MNLSDTGSDSDTDIKDNFTASNEKVCERERESACMCFPLQHVA